MAAAPRENEIKLRVDEIAAAKRLLSRNGFRIHRKRVFERNLVFDSARHGLRVERKLLRLRQAGNRAVVTFKGPPDEGRHKSREEIEVSVSEAAPFQAILERLGFAVSFIYEKYRTEYTQPDRRGFVTLDETPIGAFLELEGPPEWVDSTARLLGFGEADYITSSYGALYLEYCGARGSVPGNMAFANP